MHCRSLYQIAGRLGDLEATTRFWRDLLGLRVIAHFEPPGILFIDLGGPRLLLEGSAPTATLYLAVDDLDAAYAELGAAGVVFHDAPQRVFLDEEGTFGAAGEEERMVFLDDPGGNLLALVERRPGA
ncbi:MAG TPA: VOC family protein [Pseudomonadales bacterium]|nr:VOC family protein [Pseudomonadales bacterium]